MEEQKEEVKINNTELKPNENILVADTSFLIDKVEYVEPTEYEKKMLQGTKNPKELIESEVDEVAPVVSEKKAIIDMVKIIALFNKGHYVLSNPSTFNKRDKDKIISEMDYILRNISISEIQNKFNDICNDHIFTEKCNFDNLPLYPLKN